MGGIAGNDNGWKWLYMALNGWNNLEWLGKLELAGIAWNGWT